MTLLKRTLDPFFLHLATALRHFRFGMQHDYGRWSEPYSTSRGVFHSRRCWCGKKEERPVE